MSTDPVQPLDMSLYADKLNDEESRVHWTEQALLNNRLRAEAALTAAQAELGIVPRQAADEIIARTRDGSVTLAEYIEEYKSKQQEIAALVSVLSSKCREPWGGYVHWGSTTQDIMWTSTALSLQGSIAVLEDRLRRMQKSLVGMGKKYRTTIMAGRTQGQHGPPITFGWYLAVSAHTMQKHLDRLESLAPRLLVGKFNGAVGSAASFGDPDASTDMQRIACEQLGLYAPLVSQLDITRDAVAEYGSLCGNIATSIEKIAGDLWNMQRPEIGEVSEAFEVGRQIGSSTLAHKRNPINLGWIQGGARLVRAHSDLLLGSFATDLRDATRFAVEYSALPLISIVTPAIIQKLTNVLDSLVVDEERMRSNFDGQLQLSMDEAIMQEIARSGVGRQKAHELMYTATQAAQELSIPLKRILLDTPEVMDLISSDQIDCASKPENYLGTILAQTDKLFDLYDQ